MEFHSGKVSENVQIFIVGWEEMELRISEDRVNKPKWETVIEDMLFQLGLEVWTWIGLEAVVVEGVHSNGSDGIGKELLKFSKR